MSQVIMSAAAASSSVGGSRGPHSRRADRAQAAVGEEIQPRKHSRRRGDPPSEYVRRHRYRRDGSTSSRIAPRWARYPYLPALVVADELDADWKRVKIEQASVTHDTVTRTTDGSHSIRSFLEVMREAGAAARLMLIRAAAQRWGAPDSECRTDLHTVVHTPTGRRLGYGELASAASKLPVPPLGELPLSLPAPGVTSARGMASYDLSDIVTGKALYGMDARVDGMVYASIEHPPVLGGTVEILRWQGPLKVAGVRQIVPIDPFQAARRLSAPGRGGRDRRQHLGRLSGTQESQRRLGQRPNEATTPSSTSMKLQETARKPGKLVRNEGDVDATFAKGGKTFEADYYVPLLAHAPMEPLVALAEFKDGKVTAWAPTQNPQAVQDIVSKELGIPKDHVICHVTLLGGAFGRKSKPDYVARPPCSRRKWASRQGGVGPARRHQVRLLQYGRRHVHEGGPRSEGKTDGMAAAVSLPAHHVHL